MTSALLCAGAGTIINAAGLIAAIMVWKEWQTELSVGIGLILMLLGTGIFLAGQVIGGQKRTRARRLFILPNIWILSFIPFSCAFNVLDGLAGGYTGLICTGADDWKFHPGVCPLLDRISGDLRCGGSGTGKETLTVKRAVDAVIDRVSSLFVFMIYIL